MRVQRFPWVIGSFSFVNCRLHFVPQRGRWFFHEAEPSAAQWRSKEPPIHRQRCSWAAKVSPVMNFSYVNYLSPMPDRHWQDELRNAEPALHAATEKYNRLRQAFAACQKAITNLTVSVSRRLGFVISFSF